MSFQIISVSNAGGCSPSISSEGDTTCSTCAPKLALSYEEEAILGRMRDLKAEVRIISGAVKELDTRLFSAKGYLYDVWSKEREDLVLELEGLRETWREWTQKLDYATEQKLIRLGHREISQPTTPLN